MKINYYCDDSNCKRVVTSISPLSRFNEKNWLAAKGWWSFGKYKKGIIYCNIHAPGIEERRMLKI